MSKQTTEVPVYLKRPLYIYDLPPELLDSLIPRASSDVAASSVKEEVPDNSSTQISTLGEDGISKSASCTLCQAVFRDVTDQRLHVRSDFHRYNLKLSLKGIPPVDEQTFIKQIGDLDESISGSDSSDSEEDQDAHPGDSVLAALLRRKVQLSEQEDDSFVVSKRKRGPGNAPILWLSSPKVPEDTGLGIYRAVLSNNEQDEAPLHLVDIIRRKQLKPIQSKHSGNTHQSNGSQVATLDPHFFLCMIGGGHFAAAIIGLAPEVRKGAGGIEERHAVVKAHKTFHRYTTRRKQGGSQSANDNAKGNAHSAGSSIRRYNEAALENDVRGILTEWKSMIDSAELLFVRATGVTSRRTLFGPYDGQVLRSNDERLRGFPFSTRRATQGELLRSFQELTRFKISTFTRPAGEDTQSSDVKQTVKPTRSKPTKPERNEEEESAILHTSQLQNMIRRKKAPGLLLYLTKNSLSANFRFFPYEEHHHSPTPLHLSASTNTPALITSLLTKADADPAVTNDDGKTAYDVAGDARTRDAFRAARYTLGEAKWDWNAAHVPSAISPEEAEAKSRRDQEAADAAETERRHVDLEKIRQQEEARNVVRLEKKAGTGKTLGNMPTIEKTGSEKREEEVRGLTPEMRMRLERERRARAAEARLKALSGAGGR